MKTIESASEASKVSPSKKVEKAQIVTEDRNELEISSSGVKEHTKEPLETVVSTKQRPEIILELNNSISSESDGTLDSEADDTDYNQGLHKLTEIERNGKKEFESINECFKQKRFSNGVKNPDPKRRRTEEKIYESDENLCKISQKVTRLTRKVCHSFDS